MILKRFINHLKWLWGFTQLRRYTKNPDGDCYSDWAIGETPFNNLKLTVYESY